MTVKQIILKYLDRMCRNIPITAKRIAQCAGKNEVLDIRQVTKVMGELVETGEWETIGCWSTDGHKAYLRIVKEIK